MIDLIELVISTLGAPWSKYEDVSLLLQRRNHGCGKAAG